MLKRKSHTMDTAFALVLFAVFAVSAILLVLLGAGIYGRIGEKLNKMDAPVLLSYVTEKLRSCENEAAISIEDGESLILKETIEGKTYETWIYRENGYLKETLMPEGNPPIENAGNKIAPIQEFSVREISDTWLEITVTDDFGKCLSRYYAVDSLG